MEGLLAAGLLRAGPDNVALVGWGNAWYDQGLLRFPGDEAARPAAAALLGDLALLAAPGGRGVPVGGHIVAYRPTRALALRFAAALAEAC